MRCPTPQMVILFLPPILVSTILAILNIFFEEHLDVLLYICDDSDGREANRNRLFLAWFKKHATPDRFTIRTANAIVEGKGFYAAIIARTETVAQRRPNIQPQLHMEFSSGEKLTAYWFTHEPKPLAIDAYGTISRYLNAITTRP